MNRPPVALFVYNRPETTARVVSRLREIRPGRLLVVADGPRTDRAGDVARCGEVLDLVFGHPWDCEVLTNLSRTNLGLGRRFSSGLMWVFDQVEEAVILEDDVLPDVTFYPYCGELLERYRHDTRIGMITGHNWQFGRRRGEGSYYVSGSATTLGWATWRRAFRDYDFEMKDWPADREDCFLDDIWPDAVAVKFWRDRFDETHAGLVDTWDYQWIYAMWKRGGRQLVPNVNLISYIGCRADAIHTQDLEAPYCNLPTEPVGLPLVHPREMERDWAADLFQFRRVYLGWSEADSDRSVQEATSPERRRVEVDEPRPYWSVMIPTYNCREFLRQSLASVLAQDAGSSEMHIEVVDDGSTDDPESVVRDLGGDRVVFTRQPRHLGLVGNLNTCINRARGEVIHILHADDLVKPGFYRSLQQLFRNLPEIGAACCRVETRHEELGTQSEGPSLRRDPGIVSDALQRVLLDNPITTSSAAVRRDVYEAIGGFDHRLTCCCEDKELWVRIALTRPIGFVPDLLAVYRYMRPGSVTEANLENGLYARDIVRAHDLMAAYMPADGLALLAAARQVSARWLIEHVVRRFASEGKIIPAYRNAVHALECDASGASLRALGDALSCVESMRPSHADSKETSQTLRQE